MSSSAISEARARDDSLTPMSESWVTSRHVALHLSIREAGPSSPVVIFVHGLGMSATSFERLIPGTDFLAALCDEGLTVVGLDLQGHGLSEGRRGHIPYRAALDNIGEVVSFVSERFDAPIGVAGSGLGSFLALYAALEDDRIGAVACHTIADLRGIGAFELRARGRLLASLVGRARRLGSALPLARVPLRALYPPSDAFEDPAYARRWARDPRSVRSYTLDSIVSIFLTPDDKPAFEALTKPVFVVTGERDRIVPLAGQEEAVARLSDAELFVLGGAGHMLPLEHRSQTAPRMGGWLRKVL